MALLLFAVRIVLSLFAWIVRRKAASLERRHTAAVQVATAAEREYHLAANVGKPNQLSQMTAALPVVRAVDAAQAVESRWAKWQRREDVLTGLAAGLRNWQGRKLPYTLGAVDLYGLATLVDRFGLYPYLTMDGAWGLAKEAWALAMARF